MGMDIRVSIVLKMHTGTHVWALANIDRRMRPVAELWLVL